MSPNDVREHRAATRRLRSALLLASMAAGGALAGCGNDDQRASPETAADRTPTQDSGPSSAKDPTGNTYSATSEPRDARITVVMKDVAFKPQYITALPGQTLVFTNEDEVAHKIKGVEGQYYASKRLGKGQTYAYKMKKPPQGTAGVAFTCTIHPEKMDGGVVLADE